LIWYWNSYGSKFKNIPAYRHLTDYRMFWRLDGHGAL
jgi:hypothetical protein